MQRKRNERTKKNSWNRESRGLVIDEGEKKKLSKNGRSKKKSGGVKSLRKKNPTCQSDKTPSSLRINNHQNSLEVDCLFWYCSRTQHARSTRVSTLFAQAV
jgi:hypothetical protein